MRPRAVRVGLTRRRKDRAPRRDVPCLAPFTSMHLDQLGDVRPCCQSTHVLGNVERSSLEEIWTGPEAEALREAMRRDDYSLGCGYCEWATRADDDSAAYARRFDEDEVPEAGGPPTRIEIAPSNTCNLQCTMCNGEWSSSIRSQREHLPPLPKRYGDAFFEQLQPWLPSLRRVDVFGGEPFLARESLRLFELLVDQAPQVQGVVTTNGTIWNERVERIMTTLRLSVSLSIDGATRETYEAIRVGASWDDLQQNLERFRAACARTGADLAIAHCLMVENFWELPDMVRWAASLGAPLYVNTVTSPVASSLHHLAAPELAHVVAVLERADAEVRRLGEPWAGTWQRELDRLRSTLADRRSGEVHEHLGGATTAAVLDDPVDDAARGRWAEARTVVLEVDERLWVRAARLDRDRDDLPAIDLGSLPGTPITALGSRRAGLGVPLQHDGRGHLVHEVVRRVEGRDLVERRSMADTSPIERVEVAQLPLLGLDAIRRDLADQAGPGALHVELRVAVDGTVTEVRPSTAMARTAGLAVAVGEPCQGLVDVFGPGVLDDPPEVDEERIDPITTRHRLRWADGRSALSVSRELHAGEVPDGSQVLLALDLAPTAATGAGRTP